MTATILFAALTSSVHADISVGSDGSDGVFNPTTDVEIDLGLAATASWDTPAPVAGQGVYDPEKWAVVFKYSSINIPSGVDVTFTNHPKNAPVVWLVQGDVTIAGNVLVGDDSPSQPGGFAGGIAANTNPAGQGYGPGGGRQDSHGGSYGTGGSGGPVVTYGNPKVLPLMGGSGGSGAADPGGAGGGAILIASDLTITIDGTVRSDGQYVDWYGGGGSGGAIRVIADSVTGGGGLFARGAPTSQPGGLGRIRVEGNTVTLPQGTPDYEVDIPDDPVQIFPQPDAPVIRITQVDSRSVPADPAASLEFPKQDVEISSSTEITVSMEAQNMPTGWIVELRAVPTRGDDIVVNASLESGDNALSYWSAQLTLPSGTNVLQVRGFLPE